VHALFGAVLGGLVRSSPTRSRPPRA
jgi:hypothetical protein